MQILLRNNSNLKRARGKDLVVFDLDGTLARTKSPMDKIMVKLFANLLEKKLVAVIGGGKYDLFKLQLLSALKGPKKIFNNLFLFPTTSTSFYRYENGWKNVYMHNLLKSDRVRIMRAFGEVMKTIHYKPPLNIYGKVIEDRGTQVTFSALGQDIVKILGEKEGVRLKEKWKKEHTDTKMKIAKLLRKRLPDLEVHAAGYTSIDVTKKGIDKAYGVREIEKHLHVPVAKMLFVGDAIFPGGNDYAALKTGVDYVKVSGPEDTKKLIRAIME